MQQSEAIVTRRVKHNRLKRGSPLASKAGSRYSVGLPPDLALQVEKYAKGIHTSRSKAIASLVKIGLEHQEQRKQEFFGRLKAILDNDDPKLQDRLVDEFRDLILGH